MKEKFIRPLAAGILAAGLGGASLDAAAAPTQKKHAERIDKNGAERRILGELQEIGSAALRSDPEKSELTESSTAETMRSIMSRYKEWIVSAAGPDILLELLRIAAASDIIPDAEMKLFTRIVQVEATLVELERIKTASEKNDSSGDVYYDLTLIRRAQRRVGNRTSL